MLNYRIGDSKLLFLEENYRMYINSNNTIIHVRTCTYAYARRAQNARARTLHVRAHRVAQYVIRRYKNGHVAPNSTCNGLARWAKCCFSMSGKETKWYEMQSRVTYLENFKMTKLSYIWPFLELLIVHRTEGQIYRTNTIIIVHLATLISTLGQGTLSTLEVSLGMVVCLYKAACFLTLSSILAVLTPVMST